MSSSTDITRRDGDGHIVASEMKGNPLIFEKVFFVEFFFSISKLLVLLLFFIYFLSPFIIFSSSLSVFFLQANTQTIFQSYRHHQHWIGSELNKRLDRYTHGIRIYFHIGLLCTYVWCVL